MRVLLTGAAGFIGSHVCEALSTAGHEVVALDCLLPESYDANVKRATFLELARLPGVKLVNADLRTDPLDHWLEGVDAVINEAAMPGLMNSWSDFSLYAQCNLMALDRLVQASSRANIGKFIQISTSSVYGRTAIGDETAPTEPFSPYGVTKLAAEKLLLAHCANFGFPAVVLRYFSIYGPRQRPDMAYHRFAEALLDGRPMTVFGDGQQSRSNTYVGDAVRATVEALHTGQLGGIYNISGGESIRLLEAIEVLAGELGVRPEIDFAPARPGDQRDTFGVTTRARDELGWSPRISPVVGLRLQAQWHQRLRDTTIPKQNSGHFADEISTPVLT